MNLETVSIVVLMVVWEFAYGRWRQNRRNREIATLRRRVYMMSNPWRPQETDIGRIRWFVESQA